MSAVGSSVSEGSGQSVIQALNLVRLRLVTRREDQTRGTCLGFLALEGCIVSVVARACQQNKD